MAFKKKRLIKKDLHCLYKSFHINVFFDKTLFYVHKNPNRT